MFDIGFWEIIVISLVALIVVGPERLPKLIRVVGLWVGRAQATLQTIKADISKELRDEELRQALEKPDNLPNLNEKIHLDDEPETIKRQEKTKDEQ